MKRSDRGLFTTAVAAIAVVVAIVAPERASAQEYQFGGLVSLDGPASFVGVAAQSGLKAAVEVINADPVRYLGNKSRSIRIDIRNAGASNAQALTLAREFAGNSSILGILGPSLSPQALALAPFAQQSSIPLVIMHSPAGDLTSPGNYVFATAQDGEKLAGYGVGAFLKKYPGTKRAGIIYGSDNQGQILIAQAATKAFKAGGAEVTEFSLPFSSLDFSNAIDTMKRANVEVIYLGQGSPAITAGVQQAERVGFKPRYVGYGSMAAPTVMKNVGNALDGSIIATDYDPSLATGANTIFTEAYRKVANTDPDTFAAHAYGAVMLVAQALKALSGTPTRAEFAAALAGIRESESVLGTGTFGLTDKRTAATPPALLLVVGSELRTYK